MRITTKIFRCRVTYLEEDLCLQGISKIDLKSLIYGHCFPTVSHLAKEATTTDFFNVSLHLWKTLLMRREVCLTSHQYNDISNVFHFKNIKIVFKMIFKCTKAVTCHSLTAVFFHMNYFPISLHNSRGSFFYEMIFFLACIHSKSPMHNHHQPYAFSVGRDLIFALLDYCNFQKNRSST